MSDTERLASAAGALERRAVTRLNMRSAAEDRAVAALLRSLAKFEADAFLPSPVLLPALAVADAVLGVPASPKEQT